MVDEATVARAMAGDADAFGEIAACHDARLFRFLVALIGDREMARDLTQETFLSAYRAIPRIERELNVTAWLYSIARNHALSALRRRRLISWLPLTSQRRDGTPAEEAAAGRVIDPAETVVAREGLREALAKLPAQSRALLILAAEGFSYAEMAAITGLGVPAVRQRLYRAREQMRILYQDRE